MEPNDTLRPMLVQLDSERFRIERLRNYYDGKHPSMNYSTARYREAFGQQLAGLSSNFMRLVVDTIAERINLVGFRFGGAQGDPDSFVWDTVWQANGLDSDASLAHIDALVTGRCPLMVWPDAVTGAPRITVEDGRWCKVRYARGDRRRRLDAFKVWTDEQGYGRCTVFTPDTVRLFRSTGPVGHVPVGTAIEGTSLTSNGQWRLIDTVPNPFGAVPIVELRPRPRIDGSAASEIEPLLGLQDAINKVLCDGLVAAEFGAFQQRWVTGIDVPRDDSGQPLQPFSELARLLVSESAETRFGQFDQVNLDVFSNFMRTLIEHLSSQSGIPGHVLLRLSGQYPSGEALQAAESSLVGTARRFCVAFGESYEEIVRLALSLLGDPRALDQSAEAIWRDPAQHNVGALTDSLMKLQALGVPREALWGIYGATPQQIEAWSRASPVPSTAA